MEKARKWSRVLGDYTDVIEGIEIVVVTLKKSTNPCIIYEGHQRRHALKYQVTKTSDQ